MTPPFSEFLPKFLKYAAHKRELRNPKKKAEAAAATENIELPEVESEEEVAKTLKGEVEEKESENE